MQLSSTSFARPLVVMALLCFYGATSTLAIPSLPHPQSLSTRDNPKLPPPVEVIYEFPPGISLENIAVRRNGQILTTVLSAPKIYQVDPSKKREPILLYTFPANLVAGIAELQPDVFYVATDNTTADNPFAGVPGSLAIWKVDLRRFSPPLGKSAEVTKIVTIPQAQVLNGLAVLDHRKGLLVIADPLLGRIWRVNVYTKEIKIFTDDPLTKAGPNAVPPIGVNGIKVRHGAVYWSNSLRNIIARINVDSDGTAKGPAVVVATGSRGIDDFAIGPNGAFFAAEPIASDLAYAPAVGGELQVITNITLSPTAVAFGRRSEDAQSVYLSSTGGSLADFASGTPTRGRIFKVDVSAFLVSYGRGYDD